MASVVASHSCALYLYATILIYNVNMKKYFSFSPEAYDYWSIIDTIRKYYPIGIENDSWMCYMKDPSRKELEEIVVKNIHEQSSLKEVWNNMCSSIEADLNKESIGTTFGQSPCFSAEIDLEKFENEQVWYRKKLCFAISLLGPFYSIYGIDFTAIKYPERDRHSHYCVNAITVSPFKEFEAPFLYLQKKIEEAWNHYRLVPFNVLNKYVRGLRVPHIQQEENTVYHALFNHMLLDKEFATFTRGDSNYGYEKWLIPGAKIGGWTAYPPNDIAEE
jgi:hypothetical protein